MVQDYCLPICVLPIPRFRSQRLFLFFDLDASSRICSGTPITETITNSWYKSRSISMCNAMTYVRCDVSVRVWMSVYDECECVCVLECVWCVSAQHILDLYLFRFSRQITSADMCKICICLCSLDLSYMWPPNKYNCKFNLCVLDSFDMMYTVSVDHLVRRWFFLIYSASSVNIVSVSHAQ